MATYLILTIVANILIHKSLLRACNNVKEFGEFGTVAKAIIMLIVMLLWPVVIVRLLVSLLNERR